MTSRQKFIRFFIWLGITILQFISTQVVTFLVSLITAPFGLFKDNFPQTNPVLFVILLGLSYGIGVFGTGWLAMRVRWLKINPRLIARLFGALIGAYLPLLIALFLYHPMEAGNPFFFIAMLTSVAGFYLGGLIGRN